MHTIFQTDCFVLKSNSQGEANKVIDLLSRDFGLVRATAQGLRYLKSKLRYSLTDFSHAQVSLIRGREVWRIISANKIGDVPTEVGSKEASETMYRIFALLSRLLQGEDPHPELYDTVENAFYVLKGADSSKISIIEELTVLRILYLLGYVKDDPSLRTFVESVGIDNSIIKKSESARKIMVSEINRALHASHL